MIGFDEISRPRQAPKAATVRAISRDRYEIKPSPGHVLIAFQDEIVVLHDHGDEVTRLGMEPAPKGKTRTLVRTEGGAIEVIYHDGV